MRTKQVIHAAAETNVQMSLFPLFDAAETENPRTQALPAGGVPDDRPLESRGGASRQVGATQRVGLPKPSPSGPASSENPTTTASYGRPNAGSVLRKNESPVQDLARQIAERLRSEPAAKIDNRRLDGLSRTAWGTAVGHARDAYDATEAGMNLHIATLPVDVHDAEATLRTLLDLTARMPRQTRRDERQVELQQFSTPPAQAFLVVMTAGIEPGMTVLEPSAGTGNIAVFARMAGGHVEANEIDPRRIELLRMQGFATTAVDAERLNNLLDPQKHYEAVVMNPPFSATGGRVRGHNTRFGARHVEQALLRLRPGGRLVAVVGQGMAMDRVGFRDWWTKIQARYRVRADVGMDGNAYGKFGTSFGNRIIAIDNDGPTARDADIITGSECIPHEAYQLLRGLGAEDVAQRVRRAADRAGVHADEEERGLSHTANEPREAPDVGALATETQRQAADIEVGTVFSRYRVQKAVVEGAEPHPANVVESITMASVESPDITYRHRLPADVIVEGRISDLQIEDTVCAGQATETMLPNGMRRGHWNGDGTGIGKGREVYAFIYDQLEHGRKKHVHISTAHQLGVDAERDRAAVGVPLRIIHQSRLKPREVVTATEGVFFTTYTMLAQDFRGKRQRFNQLVDWLGSDFDGVIAFDESHQMKNATAVPHGGKASTDSGTQRGNMGIELQRAFPNARVRYFSATGATEVRHMAPYERLGLWGPGAPFPDFPAFVIAMDRGGVAAMEMLCRDLKAVGSYLARTISYGPTRRDDGSIVPDTAVTYEPLLHRMTDAERRQYDVIADLWSELLIAFETAEATATQSRNPNRYAQFYSAQQRFFLQLMMACELPDVIPAIERDLREGRSVVVSLFNTGEAQTDRKVHHALAHGIDPSELDATPREMIVQLIEKHFPIHQYQEETDPVTGKVRSVRVEDESGNPEINRENLKRQKQLLETVSDLDFPQNPIDTLINHFGPENVAEITGRTHRFEHGKYVRRKIAGVGTGRLNEFETRQLQDGTKRLAVVSGAGAMGISLHADVDAENRQRRVFYAFQLSWSADQQMQVFGRVHRSHQASAPIIRLVLLDLAGQKRQVNAVSKRLAALGALTKGERQSLGGAMFQPEDVTDRYGAAALSRFYREIETNRHRDAGLGMRDLGRMGVLNKDGTGVREAFLRKVNHFLNRIMVLPVQKQNTIFELFYVRYLETVEGAKRTGAFDFGVEELRARDLKNAAPSQTLNTDDASGARTVLHALTGEVDVVRLDFETVRNRSADVAFYRNRRGGTVYAVATHQDDTRNEVVLTGVKATSRRIVERHELVRKYQEITVEVARKKWDAAFARTPAAETQTFYVLTGAIIPIYDKIMGGRGIDNTKVARAILANGDALVGFILSGKDVAKVKQRLGIGNALTEASADEVLDLLRGGSIIELDNGWQLAESTVAGEGVLEVILSGVIAEKDELRGYGFFDETVCHKRRWFAHSEIAEQVFDRLLGRRKPVKDTTDECSAA